MGQENSERRNQDDVTTFGFCCYSLVFDRWSVGHVIAAKAVAFGECLQPEYKEYQTQVKKKCSRIGTGSDDRGFTIVSGGTDNHSMLVDLRTKYPDLTGKVAEKALVAADITVNKNMSHLTAVLLSKLQVSVWELLPSQLVAQKKT